MYWCLAAEGVATCLKAGERTICSVPAGERHKPSVPFVVSRGRMTSQIVLYRQKVAFEFIQSYVA